MKLFRAISFFTVNLICLQTKQSLKIEYFKQNRGFGTEPHATFGLVEHGSVIILRYSVIFLIYVAVFHASIHLNMHLYVHVVYYCRGIPIIVGRESL